MTDKIPLPKFLTILTSRNVPVQKAMAISGKIYKDYNTPARLAELNDVKLVASGIENKDDRKTIMKAMRESGYVPKDSRKKRPEDNSSAAGPSTLSSPPPPVASPNKGKRKRKSDANDMLPDGPADDEPKSCDSFDFGEVLDDEILKTKSTVINRGPIMTAWATLVAERLGFRREEALSIASVYTEMNAISKGITLGIHKPEEERDMEAAKGGSQSYVELMGRRIPLYRTQTNQWRAMSNGSPVGPQTPFNYITRAFRQTMPHIVGSLRLLAESFTVEELNNVAWGLYTDFRPSLNEWGKRSEVKCSTILDLRKKCPQGAMTESTEDHDVKDSRRGGSPDQTGSSKRLKIDPEDDYSVSFQEVDSYTTQAQISPDERGTNIAD